LTLILSLIINLGCEIHVALLAAISRLQFWGEQEVGKRYQKAIVDVLLSIISSIIKIDYLPYS